MISNFLLSMVTNQLPFSTSGTFPSSNNIRSTIFLFRIQLHTLLLDFFTPFPLILVLSSGFSLRAAPVHSLLLRKLDFPVILFLRQLSILSSDFHIPYPHLNLRKNHITLS